MHATASLVINLQILNDDDDDDICLQELCDLMALELAKFVSINIETDNETGARERTLGFTVSFPVDHSAIHTKWKKLSLDHTVKSFTHPSSSNLQIHSSSIIITMHAQVGKELAEEINQALKKHSVDMRVFAVVS